jgi:hypothetical protein
MAEDSGLIAFEYLLNGSERSMQNVLLSRLADARNRQKDLVELLEKWAERRAEALLLEWFLKHGDALMAAVASSSKVTEIKRLPDSPEEFRETLRNLLESA